MTTPPHSEEAEVCVLGAMLQTQDAVDAAMALLKADDFYRPRHTTLFAHMAGLRLNGEAVDPVTLKASLEAEAELEGAGDAGYLADLLDVVPDTEGLESHCRIVKGTADLRRMLEACKQGAADILEANGDDPRKTLGKVEQRVFEAARERATGGLVSTADSIWDAMEDLERWQKAGGGIVGVPTGLHDLDRKTSGMHPGDLTVLAGRPSMGKTALALCVVLNVSVRGGDTVAVFSLEMSKEQLVHRMLAIVARLDLAKMRRGKMEPRDFERMNQAAGRIQKAPIYIDDQPGSTVAEMMAKARRQKNRHGLDLLVVDYLQLMDADGRNRVEQVTNLSRGMKLMAKDLGVPVLCLSQLSRGVEHRSPPRPVLSDLRDSGSIEQDADNVLMLWRPEVYMESEEAADQDLIGLAELIVAKQRNGPTGVVELRWDGPSTRFDSMSRRDEERIA